MEFAGFKSSWPEVVGIDGEAAEDVIKSETSGVRVIVLKSGSLVTGDFRCDRVRIFVNGHGIVTSEPRIAATEKSITVSDFGGGGARLTWPAKFFPLTFKLGQWPPLLGMNVQGEPEIVSGKRSRVARVDDEEVSGQKKRKENMVHKEGVIVDLSLDGNGYGSLAKADAVVTQLGVSGAADMKIKSVG
ncbi:hypothetical protein LWI28_015628 [Acer negundo]|uniref:Uncharacterized protein n=1 Tax=Acer negundo TaxID=4023 RepID=A0AAD5P270_ACENE|nr:hypothetical protein LWI28_015628 [Acer negundo]